MVRSLKLMIVKITTLCSLGYSMQSNYNLLQDAKYCEQHIYIIY